MLKKQWIVVCLLLVASLTATTVHAQEPPQAVLDAVSALGAHLGRTLTLANMAGWTWEQKNFPDTSMDCPQPGQSYAQVITNGFIVRLTFEGVVYDYRASADRQTIFLCSPGGGAPVVSQTPLPTLAPTLAVPPPPVGAAACPGGQPVRLAVGMKGRSIATGSINIRNTAGATSAVSGLLLPGGQFDVIGGPQCVGSQTWWRVSYTTAAATTSGWVMEGDAPANDYWLEPLGGAPAVQPALGPLAPITAFNAAQVRSVAQAPLNLPAAHVAFLPAPSLDALIVQDMIGVVVYYSGTAFQPLSNVGHTTAVNYLVAAGPRDATSSWIATIEQDPVNMQNSALWMWTLSPGPSPTLTPVYGIQLPVRTLNAIAFSPDGSRFAVSSGSLMAPVPSIPNAVWVWDTASGAQIMTLAHPHPAVDLAFSPDGTILATTTRENTVHLWTLATQTELAVLAGPTGTRPGAGLAFSPNGMWLAVAADDGMVRLWDVTTRSLVYTLPVANGMPVRHLAFSPDGTVLAAGVGLVVGPQTVTGLALFDPASGALLASLPGQAEPVLGLHFSADSTQLIAVGTQTWWVWGVG